MSKRASILYNSDPDSDPEPEMPLKTAVSDTDSNYDLSESEIGAPVPKAPARKPRAPEPTKHQCLKCGRLYARESTFLKHKCPSNIAPRVPDPVPEPKPKPARKTAPARLKPPPVKTPAPRKKPVPRMQYEYEEESEDESEDDMYETPPKPVMRRQASVYHPPPAKAHTIRFV